MTVRYTNFRHRRDSLATTLAYGLVFGLPIAFLYAKFGNVDQRLTMYMPNEVAVEIFLRLPVKSTLRFRCVCKKWCKFFKHNSDFVSKQLNHSIEKNNFALLFTRKGERGVFAIDYDPSSSGSHEVVQIDFPFKDENLEIVGSCNGLLLIKIDPWLITGLWNPATKEYKLIPRNNITPVGFKTISNRVDRHGFGYDQESNDYKLVTITSPCSQKITVSEVDVYTLSSHSWKRIDHIPYKIMGEPPGVFVNGALHWLAKPRPITSKNKFSQVILSFNMAKEVFTEIPHLEYFDDGNKFKHKCIDVLEGYLAMLCSNSKVGFEVWVMNDYGIRESWTKRYNISLMKVDFIPSFWYLRRIHSLKNGEILLEIQLDDKYKYAAMFFYDPKCKRVRAAEVDLGKYDRRWSKIAGDHLKSRFHTES
ncbi:F-box protein CPR1-like [Papaver somniferum]|uniref:F-box protein CPR1-like n=1 Tax=Papaver somniferum TaxID=3469 RepID=UPI000E6FE0F1|nr:F-box protein CPR1-like [Papaver somniferum]